MSSVEGPDSLQRVAQTAFSEITDIVNHLEDRQYTIKDWSVGSNPQNKPTRHPSIEVFCTRSDHSELKEIVGKVTETDYRIIRSDKTPGYCILTPHKGSIWTQKQIAEEKASAR